VCAVGVVSVVSVRGLVAGDPSVVYVGRACCGWQASPLGNPFRVGRDGSRAVVIARYRSWLWSSVVRPGLAGQSSPGWVALVGLARQVAAGQSLVLGCWCAPLPCHASVVASCVRWLAGQGVCRG